jgi:hypothetical protein
MSRVTAKFKVARKTDMGWAHEVEFTPDYADGRNAEWAEATPAGMIRMTIKNEVAAEQFEEGAPYTVTFEREQEARVRQRPPRPSRSRGVTEVAE